MPPIQLSHVKGLQARSPSKCSRRDTPSFVAEAGDGDVDLRLAVRRWAALAELQRLARICVLLRRTGGFVGPDFGGSLAP